MMKSSRAFSNWRWRDGTMRTALRCRYARVDRNRRSPRPAGRLWAGSRPPRPTGLTASPSRESPRQPLLARGPTAAVLALLLVVAAGSACRRKAATGPRQPALRLGEVTIRVEGGDPALDEARLAERLRMQFQASGLITAAADAADMSPVVRLAGRVATEIVEADHKGLCRAAVSLAITTRPSDAPGALNEEITAGGEEKFDVGPASDRRAIAANLAERTATDLLGAYLQRTRLRWAPAAELHVALASDAATPLREEAARQVGVRQLREEAPRLLVLLDDPDEATRDAALGALIALRDTRAVAKLTRDRSLRDRHEMLKILDAISLIGGEEAAEYLAFVADSHDDADIRQAAREARDRLQRRTDAGR
jgi:hypothetical protein